MVNSLHTETRGRFRWLETVEDDDGLTFRTVRVCLPGGLAVERVETCGHDGEDVTVVFVGDRAGNEMVLTTQQSTELGAALGELPT